MKTRTIIGYILLLVFLDQAIKLVIYTWFIDVRFEIIPPLFYFEPFFNSKYSYVNSLLDKHFGINIGFWPHILIFLFAQYIVLAIYRCFRTFTTQPMLMDAAIIFGVAGIAGAFIGNICWEKGTLDYIYLKPLFIFDLKDVYINTFVVLFLIYANKHRQEVSQVSAKELFAYGKFWVKPPKTE